MYYESEGRDGDDNDDNNDNDDDNDGSLLVEQCLLFRKMERKEQKEREACSHPVYRAPHTYMYLNSLFRFLLSLSLSFPLSPSPSPPPFSTQVQLEARLLAAQKEQVSISSFLNVSPALQNKHMQTTLATVEAVSVVRLQDFPTEHQPSILALGARYYIPTYRCYVCT